MGNVGGYLRPRMQEARSALDVLLEVLCSSQSKQSSFRSFFIISRKFHHFSMRCETSMTRAFDDASSRCGASSRQRRLVPRLPLIQGRMGYSSQYAKIMKKSKTKSNRFRDQILHHDIEIQILVNYFSDSRLFNALNEFLFEKS